MIVKEVLKKIGIESEDNRVVKGIAFSSKDVVDGYIFVAYKGDKNDGNDYISEAFSLGAVCVISDRLVGYDIYKSRDINKDKSILVKEIYKFKKIKLIGITGTNGKTSTVHLLYQALNNLGVRATYIGTLGVIDSQYYKEIDNTTPGMDVLYREIYKAYKRKCEYVVMEVSSHALSMDRVEGLDFSIIAFTNLTQDHLDYYKDMNSYFNAKKLLFDNAKSDCLAFVNNEDGYSNEIIRDFKGRVIKYGKDSEYDYSIIKNDLDGISFKVNNLLIESKLIFETNLYNLLLTYVVLESIGYDKEKIIKCINNCDKINGRMDVIYNGDFSIVLDYAHTPDAMERVIKETNKIKKNKSIVLFGCGGNRDKSKRAIMGRIATDNADKVFITSDNPRFENEIDIINDIKEGIIKNNFVIEKDRKLAIDKAITSLEKGDILLILGKGHEDYQIIKNTKYHLSDKEIINSCLKK